MFLKSGVEELKVGLGKFVDFLSKPQGSRTKILTHHLNRDCCAVEVIGESALGEYKCLGVLRWDVSLWVCTVALVPCLVTVAMRDGANSTLLNQLIIKHRKASLQIHLHQFIDNSQVESATINSTCPSICLLLTLNRT